MGFPKQEYWDGLPFPSPGKEIFPDPGIEPMDSCLLHCRRILLPWAIREAHTIIDNYLNNRRSLLLFNPSVVSNSLWPGGLQHTRLPCPTLSPADCSDSCPLSQWCYLAISSSCHPLIRLLSIIPSIRVFSSDSSSHQRAKVLEVQLRRQSFQLIFRVYFL